MLLHKNILLADDDADDVVFFTAAIREVDDTIKVTTANSGLAALKVLGTSLNLPDIIFLDINMPIMGGMEFLEVISRNERLRSIPIVILTTSQVLAHDCFSLGARAYLVKPPNHQDLVELLQNVLITDFALKGRLKFVTQ